MACQTIAANQNSCIKAKDVCWIVNPQEFTSTARRKILPFPCFTLKEIHVSISAFVACLSKENHSKSYNRDRQTCRNSSSEKLGTYTYTGDRYDQRNYLITVYILCNAKLFKARRNIGIYYINIILKDFFWLSKVENV